MVYESDFYTTRRPYRSTPQYSTYTTSSAPSRQIRILPGLGKVHVVHTYDRIVPYVGHKRLTVVTLPPKVYSTRPSILHREYDWIENKLRPWVGYSATNRYLDSDSSVIFDDETRLIKAQTASLLKQIHLPVPRIRNWPITPLNRYGLSSSLPVKYSDDTYIHKLLTVSPTSKVEYATYYTEPVRKYIGEKSYNRRRPLTFFEDAVRNDIQLLSYYINKFRQEKTEPKEIKVPLSASRPSRIFSAQKPVEDPIKQEISELRDARAARLAKIYASDKPSADVENSLNAKQKKEEARLAEERALAEEQARKETQAKKDAERKAEVARQEELAAQAAAERAAELERLAEQTRQEELAKQAEIAKARQLEEERARKEEQRRLEEEAKAEEERKQLLRLEELARQAEEEKDAELARQAEELAELARQEAELAELERQERELQEQAAREAELAELARQEAELAELERQEKELSEQAKQETELAELARQEAELSQQEAEVVDSANQDADEELARQEAELAELERQEAELAEQAKQEANAKLAKQEAKLAELARQEAELAELARQEAELAALEAELAATNEAAPEEAEEETPAEETTAEPTVEEPEDDEEVEDE